MSPHNTKKTDNGQQTQGIFPFWKEAGETLAVLLRRFKDEHGYGPDEKITYAGRLDPMAEGIVPLLVGEARFQKDRLLGAVKTYEVDILLGISTDTADMLGLVTNIDMDTGIAQEQIESAIEQMKGITELPYPEYSSRPVDGKPLFMHARAGQKVVVPIKKVTIHSLELKEIKEIPLKEVLDGAIEVINKVRGDFRQEETVEQWKALKGGNVQMISIVATVSSGTYMRSLAERMGELLGVPALAYRIVRTEVKGVEK
ncbi:MAG: ine55 [Candidatus Nomurabacteria bacterium]|nr:ine55 [Candidatus Nomurabacteria bacterium]